MKLVELLDGLRFGRVLCCFGLAAGLALGVQPAHAQSVKIVPGKWQVTSTTITPMTPKGLTNTTTDCMTDREFNPAKQLGQNSDCKVIQSSAEGGTVRWTMSCNTEMGPATGRGSFTSGGDSASGQMVVNLEFQGQPVEFDTRWEGKRIGDCS